jgi:hypothetical protein
MAIPEDLMDSLKTLRNEGVLSDYIYNVKESEREGWYGPRVTAWSEAVNTIQWYVDKQWRDDKAENKTRKELERITLLNVELLKLLKKFNIEGTKSSRFSGDEPNESASVKGVVFTIKDEPRSKVFQDFMDKYFKVKSKEY